MTTTRLDFIRYMGVIAAGGGKGLLKPHRPRLPRSADTAGSARLSSFASTPGWTLLARDYPGATYADYPPPGRYIYRATDAAGAIALSDAVLIGA